MGKHKNSREKAVFTFKIFSKIPAYSTLPKLWRQSMTQTPNPSCPRMRGRMSLLLLSDRSFFRIHWKHLYKFAVPSKYCTRFEFYSTFVYRFLAITTKCLHINIRSLTKTKLKRGRAAKQLYKPISLKLTTIINNS